ncbi:ankyrin repeat-containing domain protein, partial [Tribonema minus]
QSSWTALHCAIIQGPGCLAIVKHLLAAGADVTAATRQNRSTPLLLAAVSQQLDVLKLLLEYPEVVECINEPDVKGYTPLALAVLLDDVPMAELLLQNGASPTCGMQWQTAWYPLSAAVQHNNADMIR